MLPLTISEKTYEKLRVAFSENTLLLPNLTLTLTLTLTCLGLGLGDRGMRGVWDRK